MSTAKFTQTIVNAAMVAVVGTLVYMLFVQGNMTLSSAAEKQHTPVYYHLTGDGDWSYVALGVINSAAGDVVTMDDGPFETSSAEETIDRSSDSAWVAVRNHLGCPVPYENHVDERPGQVNIEYTEIEGKEIAVPVGIAGYSGGLVFALVQASYETGFTPDQVIAATGAVQPDGKVIPVSGITAKTQAAAAAVVDLLLVSSHNYQEARNAAPSSMRVVAVDTVGQALRVAGFPQITNCAL